MEPIVNRMTAFGQYANDDDTSSSLKARDYKDATDLIVEPVVFVKAKRAQNDQDDETWKTDAPHPTLNQFDQGDSPTVTAVVEPIAYSVREDAKANNFSATKLAVTNALQAHQPSVQSHHAQTFIAEPPPGTVRRLTPTECERLQGFPDGWTEGQADSHRYKQMGNAVAVPVVEWIMQGIVELMNNE